MSKITPWLTAAFLTIAVGALAASEANAKDGGKSSSKSESRSESKSRSYSAAPAPYCAPAPSPTPAAPAPAPTPSASPAPAPAPASMAPQAPTPHRSAGPAAAPTSSGWTSGPTTGHPLTWRIGVPPTTAQAEIEMDPPSAGPVEPAEPIVIYTPPEVRVLREVQVQPAAEVLVPVYGTSVLFDTDKWAIDAAGEVNLRIAAQRAMQIPGSRIGVATGHADVRGSKNRNRILAQNRAEAAVAYLIHYGYPRDQIDVVNAGDDQPLFTGSTPADHQGNRRVDVIVMGQR